MKESEKATVMNLDAIDALIHMGYFSEGPYAEYRPGMSDLKGTVWGRLGDNGLVLARVPKSREPEPEPEPVAFKASETMTLNGILCEHSFEMYSCDHTHGEMNEHCESALFIHNEDMPLGSLVRKFARHSKVGFNYFVSDERQTEEEATEVFISKIYGDAKVNIGSTQSTGWYSEVSPYETWTDANEFKIGGHDMNQELRAHIGKWLLIRLYLPEKL